ncbi:beta-ketoacyl synthase chain length factor [Acinetobacter sp. ASP199]|uniref:beta-ketoacyl synthase chain length factor n=1 Tax=unclassified Acinetobacter TaxID=196816 RepID=UPI001F617EA3|nr:beta-ketoacyl synthase chain length factor [Acinetobacter sp. ASP199]UNT58803.1 beta-ketoacyl synthase chain length factor [Acinetobacter sp. ASP199]
MIRLHMSDLTQNQANTTYPALEKIPAMQRRRLSSIAKIALNSAIQALEGQSVDYIVWVSQYGDEHKTLSILKDVLQDQIPSPTQFSTSVHNAISGLYSILCQDATPATSLAGSWNDALVEAYVWLKTSANADAAVLIVYYDESLPPIYQDFQPFEAFSMAAVVCLDQPNLALDLSAAPAVSMAFQEAQAFQKFWHGAEQTQAVWRKC